MQLIRYVERNPVRAKLVRRAEKWPFSSLHKRQGHDGAWLADTLAPIPPDYLNWVNESDEGLAQLRASVNKGKPLGSDTWVNETVERFCLHATVTEPGRPKKY